MADEPSPPASRATFTFEYPRNKKEIKSFKKKLRKKHLHIKTVEISNCPTTSDASKLISNESFRSSFDSLENFIILKLKINEKLNVQHAVKPKNNSFNIDRNFFISFESAVQYGNQKIIYYWNYSKNFITIRRIDDFSLEMTDFVCEFLTNVDKGLIDVTHIEPQHLVSLTDSSGYNLLMKAVDEKQNSTLIDELLKLSFDIDQKSNDDRTAADIAWSKQNYEALLLFLEANSTYPRDFNEDLASEGIKKFLQDSNDMHRAIRTENEAKVQELITKKSNLRYFYNMKNISAATKAMTGDSSKIYEILTENCCFNGPHENITEINEKISGGMKKHIRDINSKLSFNPFEKHLVTILMNTVISRDDQLYKQRIKNIIFALNTLNNDPLTKQILEITAAKKNFKIHIDFNRPSIEYMDPLNSDEGTDGLYYLNNHHIYVAAKDLLSDDKKFNAIGTLVHELCHFAMNMTFKNRCKPYAIDDDENKTKFNEIIQKCQDLKNCEEIVRYVYDCYDLCKQPAELIVRVPHMIAHYHENSAKLDELRETFKDLFDFYNEIRPKMTETQKMWENLLDYSVQIEYKNLPDIYKEELFYSKVMLQGKEVKFNQLVEDKNSKVFEHLASKQIREILLEKIVLTIGKLKGDSKFYIERDFIYNGRYKITFDKIVDEADKEKMILLSDKAGAGKSTTFKHFSARLKDKFPNQWVFYIDLKRYLNVYEKYVKNINIDSILLDILHITDKLEANFFIELLHTNKVILLYDGVDEISPLFKEFFLSFIEKVRNSTNSQQWIATRPQHIDELKKKFRQRAYKLLPFDDVKKKEFIQNILMSKNTRVSEENIVEDILKSLESTIYPYKHIDNPIMIKIITEHYADTGAILNASNLYSLYDAMIDKKEETYNKKESYVIRDTNKRDPGLTIWQIHQMYALKLIFKYGFKEFSTFNTISIDEFLFFEKWNNGVKSKWTPEAISRHGFLIVDNWNTNREFPDFVHRTFAEFFVAQFIIYDIIKSTYDSLDTNEIKLKLQLLLSDEMNASASIWRFIESYVENKNPKKFNDTFYQLTISDYVANYIEKNIFTDEILKMIKFFSIDSRFLKELKHKDGKTFFQKYFKHHYYSHDRKIKILNIYQKSLGLEWHFYTVHSQPNEIAASEIEEIFPKDFTEMIESSKKRKLDDETFFKFFNLFCFIEQGKLTGDYVKRFFKNYFKELLNYFSSGCCMVEELFKILKNNFSKCMNQLEGASESNTTQTLSHEFCQLLINLIFYNEVKPYSIDDRDNERRFTEISNKCKELDSKYEENTWPNKLNINENKSNQKKEVIKELKNYYDQVIMPIINKTMQMLQNLFDFSLNIEYSDLTDAYKAKIHHSKIKIQGKIVDDENSEFFHFLTSRQIRIILTQPWLLKRYGEKLSFNNFYVERNFIDLDANQPMQKTFDETKMILLSNKAGEGKSMTFRHFAEKLKKNFWIFYIEFKKDLFFHEKFKQDLDAIEVLQEVFEVNDEIEAEFFETLFNLNRVIFFYDGIDKISPSEKDFFIKIIEKVKNSTNNQQWISTRPQHIHELKEKFNQKVYKLVQFDDEMKRKLVQNIIKKYIEMNEENMTEEILKSLKSSNCDIDNPRMIKTITKYCIDTKINSNKFNLDLMYDDMIANQEEFKTEKKDYLFPKVYKRHSNLTNWKIHQIFALKTIYKNGFEDYLIKFQNVNRTIDINEFQLLKWWKEEKSKWTPEAISHYGLLSVDNWNTDDEIPHFVHHSIAEFFIAQYLGEQIYKLDEYKDANENEFELNFKLLIAIIKDNIGVRKFLISFVQSRRFWRMHKYLLKLITSNEMKKFLTSSNERYFDFIKLFSFDKQFLESFRSINNKTIFQECFTHDLDHILEILEIYEISLRDDWVHHTGYTLSEHFSIPGNEEIYKILTKNRRIDVYRGNIELKPFVMLICFIEQDVLPESEFLIFFENNIVDVSIQSFRNSLTTEKLMKIIEKKFNNCKDKFVKILNEKFNCEMKQITHEITDKIKQNIRDFCQKLKEFLGEIEMPTNLNQFLTNILT